MLDKKIVFIFVLCFGILAILYYSSGDNMISSIPKAEMPWGKYELFHQQEDHPQLSQKNISQSAEEYKWIIVK